MIETHSRAAFPPVRVTWFRERPDWRGCFGFTEFKQCAGDGWQPGFVRHAFHTKLVSLEASPEAIMAGLQPRTRSFVRQAERQGVVTGVEEDRKSFLATYNRFAAARGLAPLGPGHALARPGPTVVTKAVLGDRVLALRGYLVDPEAARVRNLVNCTVEEAGDDPGTLKLLGAAHSLLVYADMLRFKAEGFRSYDFGGYALGTADPKLANINRFKDSFGGQVVAEANYVSWPLHAVLAARRLLRSRNKVDRTRPAQDGSGHDDER
jgi:hypothetical protein